MGWTLLWVLNRWMDLETAYDREGRYVYLVHWRDGKHHWTVLDRESILTIAVRLLRINLGEPNVGGVGDLRLVVA